MSGGSFRGSWLARAHASEILSSCREAVFLVFAFPRSQKKKSRNVTVPTFPPDHPQCSQRLCKNKNKPTQNCYGQTALLSIRTARAFPPPPPQRARARVRVLALSLSLSQADRILKMAVYTVQCPDLHAARNTLVKNTVFCANSIAESTSVSLRVAQARRRGSQARARTQISSTYLVASQHNFTILQQQSTGCESREVSRYLTGGVAEAVERASPRCVAPQQIVWCIGWSAASTFHFTFLT